MDSTTLIPDVDDPISLFDIWYKQAVQKELNDPNAMSLATSTKNGIPSVRMVLLKDYNDNGFVFYTNKNSRKGIEIQFNKYAAVCFHWKSLRKQVRIEGLLREVNASVADEYFLSRSRQSQISALASDQSSVLQDRDVFLKKISEIKLRFNDLPIKRPSYWTGFCLIPNKIEFWLDQSYRAHDRMLFTKKNDNWSINRLYP